MTINANTSGRCSRGACWARRCRVCWQSRFGPLRLSMLFLILGSLITSSFGQQADVPVRTEGFRLSAADTTSTYPQHIAFKAAEPTDSKLAPRYLRRIREASAAEARETGRKEVLIELANEVGLDVSTFIGHLSDGSAEKAFREDLETTRRYGVRGRFSF